MAIEEDTTILVSMADIKLGQNQDFPPSLIGVGNENSGVLFDLASGENSIGRHPDNRICIDYKGVSRKHCKITVFGDDCILADLESRNGTFVNEQRIEKKTLLRKGDILNIGSGAFKFLPAGDLERQTYHELRKEADTDTLTGCFNKGFMNKALEQGFKNARHRSEPFSLIIFDLDHFKKLNDNYGHDAGDFVLKTLADVVRESAIRRGDIFVRFGGEEFVIMLPNTSAKTATPIAERLCRAVEEHNFTYNGQVLPVTTSVGVAELSDAMDDETALFKLADETLYSAKHGGRNCVKVAE